MVNKTDLLENAFCYTGWKITGSNWDLTFYKLIFWSLFLSNILGLHCVLNYSLHCFFLPVTDRSFPLCYWAVRPISVHIWNSSITDMLLPPLSISPHAHFHYHHLHQPLHSGVFQNFSMGSIYYYQSLH